MALIICQLGNLAVSKTRLFPSEQVQREFWRQRTGGEAYYEEKN